MTQRIPPPACALVLLPAPYSPSLPMVIFGVLSGASVTRMFIGGVIPGVITGLVCMLAWYLMNKNKNYALMPKATPQEVWTAFKKAFPALMMPVIMMGGILSGIFTPTEAGVVACVYAWVVSTFLYKKMNMKTLKRVAIASGKSTAVIMLIVAACQALAMVITVARIPQAIAAAISSVSSNPLVVMCLINVFVLIVGLFMDVTPALTILTPIFLPIVTGIGMDPIVFGVTMVYGLCIGLITPPVGNVLYIGIGISKITLLELLKKIWPMVVLYIAVLFLMTVVPGLITFLPNLFAGA
ncbi:MAG: TRAP transporter large permease [Dysosmobacter sp.]